MYLVKFEDEENLMAISAVSFMVDSILNNVIFKNEKGEIVVLLRMENIQGILKQEFISAIKGL